MTISNTKIRRKRTDPKTIGRDMDGNIAVGFLPRNLLWLNDLISFEWRGKVMYTGKLADIFSLVYNHHIKNKNNFQLYSENMKSMFGNGYANYIAYLEHINILVKVRRYYNGSHCNTYSVADDINLVEVVGGVMITRPTMTHSVPTAPRQNMQTMLMNDLNTATLNQTGALKWYKDAIRTEDINMDSYFTGVYAVRHFPSKFMVFDGYGRVHTNVTNLKKEIRREFLMIEEMPTSEIDIQNSQPLFMSSIMSRTGTYDERFFKDCVNNLIYNKLALAAGISRTDAKILTYKVMFGPNRGIPHQDTPDWHFDNLYPTTYRWIRDYKKTYRTYKALSREMQRTESDFVFNSLVPEIKKVTNNTPLLTVHDSIILKSEYYLEALNVFNNLLDKIKNDILVLELF